MPTIDEIFGALASSDKAIAEDDPYDDYANIAGSILKQAFTPREVEVTDSWGRPSKARTAAPTIGESILAGLVGGGTNALFGGLSENYRTKQRDLARSTLIDALSGKPLTRPEGLSGNVWTNIADQASAFNIGQQYARAAEDRKAKQELQSAALGALLKGAAENPRTADRQRNAVLDIVDIPGVRRAPVAVAQPTFETAAAPVPDVNIGPVASGADYAALLEGAARPPAAVAPTTPAVLDFDKYLDRTEGEKAPAEKLFQRDLEAPDRTRAAETQLRTQFLNQPAVVNFTTVANTLGVLQRAIDDPTAVADLDFVFGGAKALDPASTVREGEAGQIIDTQGIPVALLGRVNKELTGGQGLQRDTRQAIFNLVQRRYEENKAQVEGLKGQFNELTKSYGGNPKNVVIVPGEGTTIAPRAAPTYTVQQLQAGGYSDAEIQVLRAKGSVK